MPDLAALAAVARGLLPAGTAVAASNPALMYPLMQGETLPGAVPRRLAEFSAGRAAARAALVELGLAHEALPQGTDRAPVWPDGVMGTITHSTTACLAALRLGSIGIGLDLEPDEALEPRIWAMILLPAELDWVQAQALPGRAARQIFCAKEAAYKAQYPRSRQLFGFEALHISVQGAGFVAAFQTDVGGFRAGHGINGGLALSEGHILAAAWL
ncbi:4'-phosphopantetheinyl transferase [Neotabrizicola sp. sgz301269]|uniref:4'-phosphopantetheinyl transferase family protein n=1 Tax=Neotabrizicola sp. sgz301269 TaxID=3276282 RepID=UPI00376F9CBB